MCSFIERIIMLCCTRVRETSAHVLGKGLHSMLVIMRRHQEMVKGVRRLDEVYRVGNANSFWLLDSFDE